MSEEEDVLPEEDGEMQDSQYYGRRYDYDNTIHYRIVEHYYPHVKLELLQAQQRGDVISDDPRLIEDIADLLERMSLFMERYQQRTKGYRNVRLIDEVVAEEINRKTGRPFTLQSYKDYVNSSQTLSLPVARRVLSQLFSKYNVLAADVVGMKRAQKTVMPGVERVKKKFQVMNWTDEIQEAYEKIKRRLDRQAFLINHYLINEDGEMHMLLSGDNNSGKTATSEQLIELSWRHKRRFFRDAIEERMAHKEYIDQNGDPYTDFDVLVPPKFRLRDHFILMNRTGGNSLLSMSPFPDLIYDEANFRSINLRSMSPEDVEDTIIAFGARNKHPFIIYNYQNSNRPTLFLREKFGSWMHKLAKPNAFWMVRQRLFLPSKNPWLTKNLDKVLETGNENAIYAWFRRHPYRAFEYKRLQDMRQGRKKVYTRMRQIEQNEYLRRKKASEATKEWRDDIAERFATLIEDGEMLYTSLDTDMIEKLEIHSRGERERIKNLVNAKVAQQRAVKHQNQKKGDDE